MPLFQDLPVRLGLGAMRLTDAGRAAEEAEALIRAAVEAGVTLIDTANVYGPDAKSAHTNEKLLARVLAALPEPRRDAVTVTTKVGMARKAARWMPDGDPAGLRREAIRSREALGGGPLSLLQLHLRDPKVPFEASLEALARLHADGVARHLGLCNTTLGDLATALRVLPPGSLATVQNALSLAVPADAEKAALVLPVCTALGITFLAHSPLGGPDKAKKLASHRTLGAIAADHAYPHGAAALALAYLGTLSPAIVPLPGPTRPETLASCLAAAQSPLPASLVAAVDAAFPAFAALRGAAPPAAIDGLDHARDLATALGELPPPATEGVVLTVGIQGAGKSSAVAPFEEAGHLRLNRDTVGGRLIDLIAPLEGHLAAAPAGQRKAILDNTYPTAASRAPVIAAARKAGVPVHALWLDTPLDEARVNVVRRMLALTGKLCGPDALKELGATHANLVPPSALTSWLGAFERPSRLEGFDTVERRPFSRIPGGGTRPGLFLDVDGTLRVTRSGEKYPKAPDDFELLPGRREVLMRWHEAGWALFFVSNQSGIASGKVSAETVEAAFAGTAAALGVPVTDIAFCPHPAFPVGCFCRKPMPGLGVALIDRHGLDPERLVMVGDMSSDAGFAAAIGARYFDAEHFFDGGGVTPDA